MFRKRGGKALSLLLAFAMILSLQIVPVWAADVTKEIASISGGETISSDGTYKIADNTTGVIAIAEGVKNVTLIGNGAEWNENGMTTTAFNNLSIDSTQAPGIRLTLKDVYIDNTKAQSVVDLAGTGNTILFEGTNVIDHNIGGGGNAAIHVGNTADLTISGSGTLYFYKSAQGSGIGGNTGELNGNITFGEPDTAGPSIFAKGTKQGALIGAGSNAGTSGTPGRISFESGQYNLLTNSRGAAIGGSAGASGATAGSEVYFNGGSINLNVDFSGSAVGGGGFDSGNDAAGGKAYFGGSSVRVYVDKNAAANLPNWGQMSEGLCDVAITAKKLNNETEEKSVYKCVVDTSKLEKSADTFEVKVDGEPYFSGDLHRYAYVNQDKDKGEQTTPAATPLNWVSADDTCLYLYLTEGEHTITVNGEVFNATCDSSVIGTDAEHTTGPFTVTRSDVQPPAAEDLEISTEAQLRAFAAAVNRGTDYSGHTVTLTDNIEISGEWTPIGDKDHAFAGTFDGAGFAVSGLLISDATGGYKGLFGNNSGTIKNFSISGSIGTEENKITAGSDNIGGAVGYNGGIVSGVKGSVSVYIKSGAIYAVGGVVGQNGESGRVEKCSNDAPIEGTKAAGGIAGRSYGEISQCANAGDITGNGGGKDGIGGIVGIAGDKGATYQNSVLNCYNTGSVSNTNGRWHGGIAGMADNASAVTNCYNIGIIAEGHSWNWNPIIGHVDEGYDKASNNYSLEGLNAGDTTPETMPMTIGTVKTSEEMMSSDFVKSLNGETDTVFILDTGKINKGYPILSWQAPVPELVRITFDTTPAEASVEVKDASGQTVLPIEAGGKIYDLEKNGKYAYEVTASGYEKKTGEFTADKVQNITVTLSASGGSGGGDTGSGNVNASVWDGKSIDVSWFDPDEDEYHISTPADLAGLAALVNGIYNEEIDTFAGNKSYIIDNEAIGSSGGNNESTDDYHYGSYNFEGKTIYLDRDIDMSGGNYMPIGGQYLMDDEDFSTKIGASFCGEFDGQGHTVVIDCDRHCSGKYGDGQSVGLIGRLGVHDGEVANAPSGAAVRNVVVEGSVRGNRSVGGVVGKVGKTADDAVIENCANFAEVSATDKKGTGGIVGAGWNNAVIRNCYNAGDISNPQQTAVGGIAGSSEAEMSNCYNAGKITASGTTAAIATDNGGGSTYENCYWLDSTADVGVYKDSSGDGLNSDAKKTSAQLKSDEMLELLGSAFAKDTANINNGYPVLSFQSSGGGGSGGGGGATDTQVGDRITVNSSTEGTVTVSPENPKTGDTVTVAVTAKDGYDIFGVKVTEEDGKAVAVTNEGDGKYTFKMPEGKVRISVTYSKTSVSVKDFTDVKADDWFYSAVDFVTQKGYFNGVSETEFAPASTMTRAMFATVIGRMAGIDASKYSGSVFSDVPEGQWYSAYVKWASENGIVSGVGDGRFSPNSQITREQMAAMMYRYAKFMGIDTSAVSDVEFNGFADKDTVSSYAKEAMIWATSEGIINGTGSGLSPKNNATRAQVAQIVMNYTTKFEK